MAVKKRIVGIGSGSILSLRIRPARLLYPLLLDSLNARCDNFLVVVEMKCD
jgi:hypothetical protein